MKDFKNYHREEEKKQNTPPADAMGLAQKILAAYGNKSDADVFQAIYAEAERGKREGTLHNDELDLFYTEFSPMLSPSEQKKLKGIIERLKKI